MARASYTSALKTFTIQEYRKFSSILEDVVTRIVKKEYDIKYQEIFVDLNNKLYELLQHEEYNKYPIYYLLNSFETKIEMLIKLIETPICFMNFCIQFEFLYYDLNALFQDGIHVEQFVLEDEQAESWWKKHFDISIFVEADKFVTCFMECFPKLNDVDCILQSINFTQLEWFSYVNKHSFNLFLRFYGGWNNLETFWREIYHHPGNMHIVTLERGIEEMKNIKKQLDTLRSIDKSYVFCINWRSTEGLWNLIYGDEDGEINVTLVKSTDLIKTLQDTKRFFYPKGKELCGNRRLSLCNITDNRGKHNRKMSDDLPSIPKISEGNKSNNDSNLEINAPEIYPRKKSPTIIRNLIEEIKLRNKANDENVGEEYKLRRKHSADYY